MTFRPWKKVKRKVRRAWAGRTVPESTIQRVGIEDALLYRALCWNVNENDSAFYNLLHCSAFVRWAARHAGSTLKDATVLEVGTSRLPGLPFILLMQGARKVIANNIFEVDGSMSEAYARLIAMVFSGFTDDLTRRVGEIVSWERPGASGRAKFLPERFENLSPVPAEEIDLPADGLDVCFSLAVMEHVKRPEAVLANTFRMLKPGGWCLHAIDLRDHRNFSDPFRFLREEDEAYRAECPHGENRLRASDWIRCFQEVGYEILGVEFIDEPITLDSRGHSDAAGHIFEPERCFDPADSLEKRVPRLTERDRAGFIPRFQRYSLADLSQETINIVARKPGA